MGLPRWRKDKAGGSNPSSQGPLSDPSTEADKARVVNPWTADKDGLIRHFIFPMGQAPLFFPLPKSHLVIVLVETPWSKKKTLKNERHCATPLACVKSQSWQL